MSSKCDARLPMRWARCIWMLSAAITVLIVGPPRYLAAQFGSPTVWFSPNLYGTVHTGAAITDTVHWCSGVPLRSWTASVTQNGNGLFIGYNAGDHNGCGTYYAWSPFTITPVLGYNAITGSIDNQNGVHGSYTMGFTYDSSQVWVTPDAQGTTMPWGSSVADTFTVQNFTGGNITYNLTTTCTNSASLHCSAPSSVWVGSNRSETVIVSYQTRGFNTKDTVTLRASTSDGLHYDSGSIIETASQYPTTVSFSANNEDDQQLGLCANSCFTAAVAHGTPSYRTLGTNRAVTLIYRGDRAAAQPYVAADVSIPSTAPQYVRLTASVNGSPAQFLNGQDTLYFSTSGWQAGKSYRVAGQLDLSSLATNMYPLLLSVTAVYSDHVETFNSPSSMKMMVVNWRTLNMLPTVGWSIAGVQRLYKQSDGTVLIVEGDGSGVYFSCTYYTNIWCAGPAGDYSKLTSTGSGASLSWQRVYPDSSKVNFDNQGRMETAVDRWFNGSDVGWDTNNHVIGIWDPMSGADSITYGTGSFTIGLPSPNLSSPYNRRMTTVTYNSSSGQLTRITDPDGVSTNFTYDANGRLSTVVDRLGNTTSYYYSGNSWTLDSIAAPAVAIDGQQQAQSPVVRVRSWQRAGVPTVLTDNGSNLASAAETDTIRALVTGPLHETATFTADRWGQPLISTDPLGDTTKIVRTGIFATSVTNPLGQTSVYSYNSRGLLSSATPYGQPTTNIVYDAWAMADTVSGGNAPTVTKSYSANASYKTITTTVDGGYTAIDSLDSHGRVFYSKDPAGHTTRYHFDGTYGNPDSTLADAGQWTKVTMDSYGRDSLITGSSQQAVVRSVYDVLGRDSLTYDGVHPNPITYKYNALYLTHVVDPSSQVYKVDVNALGWPTTVYDPADTLNRKVTNKYDLEGRVTTWVNQRAQTVTQQWDKLGRLTSKRDGTTADTLWYPDLRTIVDSNAVAFDTLRLGNNGSDTVVTRIAGKWVRAAHSGTRGTADSTLLTSSIGQLQNRISYWSAARGVLDSVNIGGVSYGFGYTNELLPDTIRYPSFTRIDSVTTTHGLYSRRYPNNANVDSAFARSYAYDSLGRITTEQNFYTGVGTHFQQRRYTYTGTGTLASYIRSRSSSVQCVPTYGCYGGDTIVDFSTSYSYDAADNLKSDGAITGTFDTGDRLRSWGSASYTFDLDGNRQTKGDTSYTWSASGRLLKVTHGTDADSVQYSYNASGELVQRKTNGVPDRYFVWDEGQLILLLDGSGNEIAEYAYQPTGEPLSVTPAGKPNEIYLTDGRGNVVGVTDGPQDLLQQNYYGPWGNLELALGSGLDTTRLGWKGLVWEGGLTKLYYVHNRWYDPTSRSFISDDPLGIDGGLNTYSYAGNDPINGADPDGLSGCEKDQGVCIAGMTITAERHLPNCFDPDQLLNIGCYSTDIDTYFVASFELWNEAQDGASAVPLPANPVTVGKTGPRCLEGYECVFDQKYGFMFCGVPSASYILNADNAFSGARGYVNDPSAQYLENKGPIPVGEYYMDWIPGMHHGMPNVFKLRPVGGMAQTHGRGSPKSPFEVHGASKTTPFGGSQGCIATSPGMRAQMASNGASILRVIP